MRQIQIRDKSYQRLLIMITRFFSLECLWDLIWQVGPHSLLLYYSNCGMIMVEKYQSAMATAFKSVMTNFMLLWFTMIKRLQCPIIVSIWAEEVVNSADLMNGGNLLRVSCFKLMINTTMFNSTVIFKLTMRF